MLIEHLTLGRYYDMYGIINHFSKWFRFSTTTFYDIYKHGNEHTVEGVIGVFKKMGKIFSAWKVGMFVGALSYASKELLIDGSYSVNATKISYFTLAMWADD